MRSTTVSEDSLPMNMSGAKPAKARWWVRGYRWLMKGRSRRVRREQFLALPPSHVFAFIVDGANLEPTTPRSLKFQLLNSLPISLEPEQTLDYQWSFLLRKFQMKARVVQVNPPGLLEEVQQSGPFRVWHYLRKLKSTTGGTWVVDELEYHLPWGIFGTLLDRLVVHRKIEHWFDYRQARLIELLLADATQAAQSPSTRASRARMRRHPQKPESTE
jgi:ligand-binding SRPBCC domain-containing protein